MYIIIHRTESSEIQKIFEHLSESLKDEITSDIKINDHWRTININNNGARPDARIDFYCGEASKMAGTRPNYYNTDSESVACFLQLTADKVNGKEIKDISVLMSIIKGTPAIK